MEIDKEKYLYRIFNEDAEKSGMDMKDFYHKRRKGLLPFLNPEGEVEWLREDKFRIAAVKKISDNRKSKRAKRSKHSHNDKHNEAADFTHLISNDMYKFLAFGAGAIIIVYLIIKLLALF
ncbi:MAG: hypothetical protein H8D22_06430 [Candidatus Cloacimonetes bacterium]|nr:hypothetical protein [Candidatus Cloacimonadota bacterium]